MARRSGCEEPARHAGVSDAMMKSCSSKSVCRKLATGLRLGRCDGVCPAVDVVELGNW